jgi:type III pantothenate kinase
MMGLQKVLVLDAGNTFVKWAVAGVEGLGPVGRMASAPLCDPNQGPLVLRLWLQEQHALGVQEVWSSHVLGAGFEASLGDVCAQLGLVWCGVRVNEHPLVHSCYEVSSRLGQDRWAALLAVARSASGGGNGLVQLVVSLGTATTLDALVHASLLGEGLAAGAEWVHLGGFIIPGAKTMLSSLHAQTVQLPEAELSVAGWPVNTQDAIGAGVAEAQAAMVARCVEHLRQAYAHEPVVSVSGGDAEFMVNSGLIRAQVLHDAVLHGVFFAFSNRWEGVA